MKNQPADSASISTSSKQHWFALHVIALAITWIAITATLIIMLYHDVRYTDQFSVVRSILQVAYVSALLFYLSRVGPSKNQFNKLRPLTLIRWRYGQWIPVLGIVLMVTLAALVDDGVSIIMLLLIIATLWILIVWRKMIRLRMVVQGLAIAIIAYFCGLPFIKNGFAGETFFYGLLIFVPPMYIAGGLMIKHTCLSEIQLLEGRYWKALKSFLWGSLLFVPLGLFNAADGSPGTDITWVSEWWMPFSLPTFSGIAEETWFRLLLVSLFYLLLRPAIPKHPAIAVFAAILFSSIIFGLGHGRTLDKFLTTGLLYGVPIAFLFVRRDWEHAVGAHFMINMIPWAMVFMET